MDNHGDAREFIFTIRNNDPVFSKLSADRWYNIELMLRPLVKIEVTDRVSRVLNPNVVYYIKSL